MAGKPKGNPHNPGNPHRSEKQSATCAGKALELGVILESIARDKTRFPEDSAYGLVEDLFNGMNTACEINIDSTVLRNLHDIIKSKAKMGIGQGAQEARETLSEIIGELRKKGVYAPRSKAFLYGVHSLSEEG